MLVNPLVLLLPTVKRQKIKSGESSKDKIFSPSQSPLRLDDEQNVRRELRQEAIQGNIFITPDELEENVPQEAPKPILDLTIMDYRGNEIDPIIGQAYDQFILDNDFVKSRAFEKFLWRINMHNF